MSATDKMRNAFDDCTVMAGVEPNSECVYITKAAAMALLREVEDENTRLRSCLSDDAENERLIMGENAKLRKLVRDAYDVACNYYACVGTADDLVDLAESMRELGIEVD